MALDTLRKGAGRLFGMILMGMLVFSFGIWGIADIFRGYGQQSLIRVGDIDISTQEYLTAQHDALRAMSNEASALVVEKTGVSVRSSKGLVAWRSA